MKAIFLIFIRIRIGVKINAGFSEFVYLEITRENAHSPLREFGMLDRLGLFSRGFLSFYAALNMQGY
ncbi:unnamed protein product [Larinioides sclopetarius]|uniref:Uncharacterized protein n=1 Tax=Larinioides sclopetarius TaxID=280406 RepID=A0AAV1ZQM5_9ARAC